ncbi:MAG: amino acid carrier protein [Acidobacteriota bacterium]
MNVLESIGGFLWGPWTPWVLLFAGVLFTVWTKFTQHTAMTHGFAVVQGKYDDPDDPGAINHFQALAAALSATVGLGNIGGVALAIGIGGPGALFWMWLVGFLGMALKTIEITLAMQFRNMKDPDNPSGGAMWVVEEVLGSKGGIWSTLARIIGVFFCITLIISTFTGGNLYQAYSVATLTEGFHGIPMVVTGIVMAVIVGLVIIGGIKRIGQVAAKLVPGMCLLYVVAALVVLAVNITEIPGLLALIVKSAFNPTEAAGAFIGGGMGWAFISGMKRALFSNEAGQGSAPIAHAAAKTDEPAREGIVGGIGPFIDTICICTITALVILSTGTWNRDAIGPLGGPIRIAQGTGTEWTVTGPSNVSALPESRHDAWTAGTDLFLIGTVAGATSPDTETNKVQVVGHVVEGEGTSSEAARPLMVTWDAVDLDGWVGTPTGISLDTGVHRTYDGANLTAHAFDRQFPGLGKWLVTIAAWLFAISTMISWSYYGEQGMVYMLGQKSVLPYKIVFLIGTIFATIGIQDTSDMIIFMDLGTGAMLWSNLPIVIGLGYLAVKCLNDYGTKLKAGEFKRHD